MHGIFCGTGRTLQVAIGQPSLENHIPKFRWMGSDGTDVHPQGDRKETASHGYFGESGGNVALRNLEGYGITGVDRFPSNNIRPFLNSQKHRMSIQGVDSSPSPDVCEFVITGQRDTEDKLNLVGDQYR